MAIRIEEVETASVLAYKLNNKKTLQLLINSKIEI